MLKLFLSLAKISLSTIFILSFLDLFYFEYRHFYSLNAAERITVWRCHEGKAYIIPGQYYGLTPPTENHIESPLKNDITLYFSDKLPGTIIVKADEAAVTIHQSRYQKQTLSVRFVDYNSNRHYYDQLLYKPNAIRASDINSKSRSISVYLYDIYARDTQGNRL